jgi:hypothetical protein
MVIMHEQLRFQMPEDLLTQRHVFYLCNLLGETSVLIDVHQLVLDVDCWVVFTLMIRLVVELIVLPRLPIN